MTRLQTYYTAETLAPIATDALQTLKGRLQHFYQYNGGTMGEMGSARTSVKRINVILRERGALVDAKAKLATKDATGLIAAAIAPLKAAAMDYAVEQARAQIERVATMFEGKDLNEVAPRPSSLRSSRIEYRTAQAKRAFILSILIVVTDGRPTYRPGEKQVELLGRDAAREERYVAFEREAAGQSFDAYVTKLEAKVGAGVTAASVDGTRLWLGSVLTVTKGGTIERWHTQQIINRSVLGNLFNQWPTRLLKGGA